MRGRRRRLRRSLLGLMLDEESVSSGLLRGASIRLAFLLPDLPEDVSGNENGQSTEGLLISEVSCSFIWSMERCINMFR